MFTQKVRKRVPTTVDRAGGGGGPRSSKYFLPLGVSPRFLCMIILSDLLVTKWASNVRIQKSLVSLDLYLDKFLELTIFEAK